MLHRSQIRQPAYNNSQHNDFNINNNISNDNGQNNEINTISASNITRKVNVSDDVRNVMRFHVPINTLKNNPVAMRNFVKFMVKEKYANSCLATPDAFKVFLWKSVQ